MKNWIRKSIVWPTMIAAVCEDPIYTSEDQVALRVALPGAAFISHDGAGHNIQWEQPQQVAEDIRDFLE